MNKTYMNDYYKKLIENEDSLSRKAGWRDEVAQNRRFEQLYKLVENETAIDIGDVGCGLAGFYTFLSSRKDRFSYTGYDFSMDMVNKAKEVLAGEFDGKLVKIEHTDEIIEHDYLIASGIFNMKREIDNDSWLDFITIEINTIDQKSKKGFAFNMLTSFSDEEYKKDELYYGNPCYFFNYCKKNFSRNIALLHDYEEYDFTIIVRK